MMNEEREKNKAKHYENIRQQVKDIEKNMLKHRPETPVFEDDDDDSLAKLHAKVSRDLKFKAKKHSKMLNSELVDSLDYGNNDKCSNTKSNININRKQINQPKKAKKRNRWTEEELEKQKERRKVIWAQKEKVLKAQLKKRDEEKKTSKNTLSQNKMKIFATANDSKGSRRRDEGAMGGTSGYRPPSKYKIEPPGMYRKSFLLGEVDNINQLPEKGEGMSKGQQHRILSADEEISYLLKTMSVGISKKEYDLLSGKTRPKTPKGFDRYNNKAVQLNESRVMRNSRVQDFDSLDSQVQALKEQTIKIRDQLVSDAKEDARKKRIYLNEKKMEERRRAEEKYWTQQHQTFR